MDTHDGLLYSFLAHFLAFSGKSFFRDEGLAFSVPGGNGPGKRLVVDRVASVNCV